MTLALLSHIRGDTYGGAEIFLADIAQILHKVYDEVVCSFATSYDEKIDELNLCKKGVSIINTGKVLERTFFDSKYSRSRSVLSFQHSVRLKKLAEKLQPDLILVTHEPFNP
jgi:hypothetical protein